MPAGVGLYDPARSPTLIEAFVPERGLTLNGAGTVTKVGSPPNITIGGEAVRPVDMRVEILGAGALGAATARWSEDGGASWTAFTIDTPVTFGSTGYSATFAAGGYTVGMSWSWYSTVTAWTGIKGRAITQGLLAAKPMLIPKGLVVPSMLDGSNLSTANWTKTNLTATSTTITDTVDAGPVLHTLNQIVPGASESGQPVKLAFDVKNIAGDGGIFVTFVWPFTVYFNSVTGAFSGATAAVISYSAVSLGAEGWRVSIVGIPAGNSMLIYTTQGGAYSYQGSGAQTRQITNVTLTPGYDAYNDQPMLDFPVGCSLASASWSSIPQPVTICAVWQFAGAAANTQVFGAPAGGEFSLRGNATNVYLNAPSSSSPAGAAWNNAKRMSIITVDGANSSVRELTGGTDVTYPLSAAGAGAMASFALGSGATYGSTGRVRAGDFYIFSGQLSAAEEANIIGFLKRKYGAF